MDKQLDLALETIHKAQVAQLAATDLQAHLTSLQTAVFLEAVYLLSILAREAVPEAIGEIAGAHKRATEALRISLAKSTEYHTLIAEFAGKIKES